MASFANLKDNSWSSPSSCERAEGQKSEGTEDDERRRGQRKSGLFNSPCCCCPCSTPLLLGLLVGALVMGVVLATLLSLYLISPGKTTSALVRLTATSTTSTTASSTTSTSSTSSSSTSSSSTRTSSTSSTSSSTSSSTATSTTAPSTTSATTSTTTSVTSTSTTTTTTTKPFCTTRITFDDIPGQVPTSGVVPNGYQGLNWTNTMYLNASSAPLSGYQTALVSPSYVAYSPSGAVVVVRSANGTSFSFDAVTVAAAWRENLYWTIDAYRSGVRMISGGFYLTTINATIITCGVCTNLDTLAFSTSGGTPSSGLAQNGTEFAFDDLCISFGY